MYYEVFPGHWPLALFPELSQHFPLPLSTDTGDFHPECDPCALPYPLSRSFSLLLTLSSPLFVQPLPSPSIASLHPQLHQTSPECLLVSDILRVFCNGLFFLHLQGDGCCLVNKGKEISQNIDERSVKSHLHNPFSMYLTHVCLRIVKFRFLWISSHTLVW